MNTEEASGQFKVANPLGLHARAAARLVQAANRFHSEVTFTHDGTTVNGKSILGVLMLAASHGAVVTVRAVGDDCREALRALGELIQSIPDLG